MTADRTIHLVAGIFLLIVFLKLSRTEIDIKNMTYGFIAMALGTWVPDWDLFVGIGFHRSPITHSALPAILVGWLVFRLKLPFILIIGFCIGLASHLLWDVIDYGNVQWIRGGNNDRLFLFVNSILLITGSIGVKAKLPTSSSCRATKSQAAP